MSDVLLAYGLYDTHIEANAPYDTISILEIEEMLKNPQSVGKNEAKFIIPSTYHEFDGRVHAVQSEHGHYVMLAGDIDVGSPALDEVKRAIASVYGNVLCYIYSSRRASEIVRKWRYLVPLREPLSGDMYSFVQRAAFDAMAEQGIQCDRKLECTGQPVFLPNKAKGGFYKSEIVTAEVFDLKQSNLYQRALVLREEEVRAVEKAKQQAAAKIANRQLASHKSDSPIDTFNKKNAIANLLEGYGYRRKGESSSWQSPQQQSGSFATRDFGDYWVSLSGSDSAAGLGAPCTSGCYGDAFDLFCFYEYGNDRDAALNALRLDKPVCCDYSDTDFDDETNKDASDGLVGELTPLDRLLAITSTANRDEIKRLVTNTDFAIKDIAPGGSMSVWYGKPNAGKTLVMLALVRREINDGRLRPDNVFYINEDDSLEGYDQKADLAQDWGINQLSSTFAPAESPIKGPVDLVKTLRAMADHKQCEGKLFIFDTLKKFCDLMHKDRTKEFFTVLRRITANGGTVILLGHANKHLDADGNVVFEGVQDVANDIDIMYAFQAATDRTESRQQVVISNVKDRGRVMMKFAVEYTKSEFHTYEEMLASVHFVDEAGADHALAKAKVREAIERRKDEWLFIKDRIGHANLNTSRQELLSALDDKSLNKNGLTEKVLRTSLSQFVKVGLLTQTYDRMSNNAAVFRVSTKWVSEFC